MKLYVMRHAITPMNLAGIVNGETNEKLAPQGIDDAKRARSTLPDSIKNIYSTDLLRGIQTSRILAEPKEIPITIMPEFSEVKMGKLSGQAWTDMENGEELKRLHRSVQYDYTEYGGENTDLVAERLGRGILEIEQRHKDDPAGSVLIVTHGGVVRALMNMSAEPPGYETIPNVSLVEFDTDRILGRPL